MNSQKSSTQLGFVVEMEENYEQAIELVTAALKSEGFGVLTKIDVKATLKEKIGEDMRPYVILGACNPHLAHQALLAEPAIGLMLPCNVTVEANSTGGSIVRIINPEMMLATGELVNNPKLIEISNQARSKLERVADSLLD
jgi:uncharacterized protein (DUF302 family)